MFTKLLARTFDRDRDAEVLLQSCEDRIASECSKRLDDVAHSIDGLDENWRTTLKKNAAFIRHVSEGREALRAIRSNKPGDEEQSELSAEHRFVTSSRFLAACHRALFNRDARDEQLILITGPETAGGTLVLSEFEQPDYEVQNAAYVKATPKDSHRRIVRMTEAHGHNLHAMFHCHLVTGATGTKPSGTDIDNQERFEKLGNEPLGGIFSRDGFIRLFATSFDFSITVHGKGWQQISQKPRESVLKLDLEC